MKSAGAGALVAGGFAQADTSVKPKSGSAISQLKKNTAIAMWDFTWILRHHPKGAFGNWDQVLEGLAERGYDSIRMDCMPQYVAADSDGRLQDEFSADGMGMRGVALDLLACRVSNPQAPDNTCSATRRKAPHHTMCAWMV